MHNKYGLGDDYVVPHGMGLLQGKIIKRIFFVEMLPQVENSLNDVKSRISSNLPDFAHDSEILQVLGPRTMHVSLIC